MSSLIVKNVLINSNRPKTNNYNILSISGTQSRSNSLCTSKRKKEHNTRSPINNGNHDLVLSKGNSLVMEDETAPNVTNTNTSNLVM